MIYRVLQFIRAMFPHIDPKDVEWALKQLSPEASNLFLQQSPPDQRHAIDVAKSIIKARSPISIDDFKNLVTAALLHDCGKSVIFLHLWHRVFIVLIQKTPNTLKERLENGHIIVSLPLKVDKRHALWGAQLTEQAGLNPEICQLIREHHNPKTDLGRLLEQADNKH